MKKIYNSPEMKVVMLAQHQMIAESVIVGSKYNGSDIIEVKENRSSDVWGFDWSE